MGLTKPRLVNALAFAKIYLTRTLVIVATASIVACGGGSNGGNGDGRIATPVTNDAWRMGVYKDADVYANRCAMPRTGIDPATNAVYRDKPGTVKDENN
ncbi:MAG: hypothetical protein EOP04_16840 [Proteobacteria bacterium]|nr:MAG: hypothetical protein EOP04_16840 [Pseudomonadota bacterium]